MVIRATAAASVARCLSNYYVRTFRHGRIDLRTRFRTGDTATASQNTSRINEFDLCVRRRPHQRMAPSGTIERLRKSSALHRDEKIPTS